VVGGAQRRRRMADVVERVGGGPANEDARGYHPHHEEVASRWSEEQASASVPAGGRTSEPPTWDVGRRGAEHQRRGSWPDVKTEGRASARTRSRQVQLRLAILVPQEISAAARGGLPWVEGARRRGEGR
jgi:hypothetical protein